MKNTLFYTLTASIILCSQPALSNSMQKPKACPDSAAIQSSGFNNGAEKTSNGQWIAHIAPSYFGTEHCWSMNTNPFPAEDKNDALNKANHALKSIQLVSGPNRWGELWICDYQTELTPLFAVTPTFYECLF